jgi:hypothetical protein
MTEVISNHYYSYHHPHPIILLIVVITAGKVAQVVECLPSKCETLNSYPSTTKNRKE